MKQKKRYGVKEKRMYFAITLVLAILVGGILNPMIGLLIAAFRVARRPWDPLF